MVGTSQPHDSQELTLPPELHPARQSVGAPFDSNTGMRRAVLNQPAVARAEVYLQGAHVTSWKDEKGEELLFLSPRTGIKLQETIHGGIQVCFPMFSGSGALGQLHGFASDQMWGSDPYPVPAQPPAGSHYIDLVLDPAWGEGELPETWTYNFAMRQRIALGPHGELSREIRIKNTGNLPLTFTFALLHYLSVSDIKNVRVEGLVELDFLGSLKNNKRKKEKDVSMKLTKKVDRIYLETPAQITIKDLEKHRSFVLRKDANLPDVVLWSPAPKSKLTRLKDRFQAWRRPENRDDYRLMLCVGAGAVNRDITLKPQEEWTAKQEIIPVYDTSQQGH